VRFRLGDPRVVPCFRCTFLLDMPPPMSAGSPSVALAQSFTDDIGLRQEPKGSALPKLPSSVSDGRMVSRLTGSLSLRPVELLAPLTDLTGHFRPANGDFYARAFGELVTLLVVGYDYGGN
jgi:hypothetical protein